MKSLWLTVALVIFVGLTALVHRGAVGVERVDPGLKAGAPMEYLPSSESAIALSLGHRSAMADVFWIRSLLYFVSEMGTRQNFEWLLQYLDVIVKLDSDFRDPYIWGGAVLIISNKDIRYENVAMANELLERGASHFPDDSKFPEAAAANCSYYIKEPTKEERDKLKACRKKFVEMAASRPGSNMALLASALAEGDEARACDLLIDSYFAQQDDPELREQVERRMKGGLCGETTGGELRRKNEEFREAMAQRKAYVTDDLFVHIFNLKGQ